MIALLWMLACGGDPERPDRDPPPTAPPEPPTEPVTEPPTVPPEPALPASCDAGTAAWVARVFPLLWGRKPHGASELELWAQVADEHGRDRVVRAMTRDPAYTAWWTTWFSDKLFVARTGDKAYPECFEEARLEEHDGTLTEHLRTQRPWEAPYEQVFSMRDVLIDALVSDDLSTVYRTYLIARMNRPVQGANVSDEELEYNRRVNFGELFFETYLNRNLTCLPCHNSEFSVTGDPRPDFDRTWEIKGHFEEALLGTSAGDPNPDLYTSMFRYEDLVSTKGFFNPQPGPGLRPWGMHEDCGAFQVLELGERDFIGQDESWFIQAYDAKGNVFDLEAELLAGVDSLSDGGLWVEGDLTVDGAEAFAYLVGANLVDQVWELATGARLTIAHAFPRNEAQAERLYSLTNVFVEHRFSLRELLVGVATDPYFNAGLGCGADPYGMEPVIDPWTVYEEDPALRGNGPGDLVHRNTARALLRSTHDALGWKPPPEFDPRSDDEELQQAIGVFLRESEPGFEGSDFQGALAFEDRYGRCLDPDNQPDAIDRILEQGQTSGATLGDAVSAVKDRLIGNGTVEPEEQVLVEALLQQPLSTPVDASDPDQGMGVRLFCGALLLSPEFHLALHHDGPGPVPSLALDRRQDCDRMMVLVASEAVTVDCKALVP